MAMCKQQAITVNGLSYGDHIKKLPAHSIDHNHFIHFLAHRRSVRNFKPKPVREDLIQKVLEAVTHAPYGAEPQKLHITVIPKREIIEKALPHMEGFLDKIVSWLEHPVASRIIKRRNTAETFNTLRNHVYPIAKLGNYKLKYGDRITRGAPVMLILHAEKGAEEHTNNAMIFATFLLLSAHSLGLGATMVGLVAPAINKVKEVRRIFQIPEGHEASMSVIMGYPKYKYNATIRRNYHRVNWIT
jgi:nitroreductase